MKSTHSALSNCLFISAMLIASLCSLTQARAQQSSLAGVGIGGYGSSNAVDSLWYVGANMHYSSPTSVLLAPVDAAGNIVTTVTADDFQVRMGCENGGPWVQIPVTSRQEIGRSVNLVICIDRTEAMKPYAEHVDFAVLSALHALSPDDNVSIIEFDHRVWNTFSGRAWDVANAYAPGTLQPGLNALYRAAYTGLDLLADVQNQDAEQLLMLFTASREQASVLFTLNDVTQYAADTKTRVYPFLLGYGTDSYPLRFLAETTGGVHYQFTEEDKHSVQYISRSVVLGNKHGLEIDLRDASANTAETFVCPTNLLLRTSIASTRGELVTYIPASVEFVRWPARHQIVSLFDDGSASIDEIFYEHLDYLAEVLNENRDKTVLLTGHATHNGSASANRALGLQRANAVKQYLVKKGLSPGQIRVKTSGSEKPLYQIVAEPWQERYNRRVEIRWLDPTLFPYELVATVRNTESKALQDVQDWTKRGYNAYYVPIFKGNSMQFQIRIWGYDSYPSALAESARIRREYNVTTTVD